MVVSKSDDCIFIEMIVSGEFGSLTHYDYEFRIYNPSIGKFLSVDPLTKTYPWYTPYQFAGNKPIWAVDLDGLEEHYVTTAGKDAYKDYFGGSVVHISNERWMYINKGAGYFRIYDPADEGLKLKGGWSNKYEYVRHWQTGTGHGLSVGEYSKSTYTDGIGKAFLFMFVGATGASVLPAMGAVGLPSGTEAYLAKNAGDVGWDAFKDMTINDNLEVDKLLFNLVVPKNPLKGTVVSFLDGQYYATLTHKHGEAISFSGKEKNVKTTEVLEGLTGDLIGTGTDQLIDLGLNKPTAKILNFGLDYINTQIWKAGDEKYNLNGNTGKQNEDIKP
jgi:RHS repeat-associated protein